jgi:hypothetical protein
LSAEKVSTGIEIDGLLVAVLACGETSVETGATGVESLIIEAGTAGTANFVATAGAAVVTGTSVAEGAATLMGATGLDAADALGVTAALEGVASAEGVGVPWAVVGERSSFAGVGLVLEGGAEAVAGTAV